MSDDDNSEQQPKRGKSLSLSMPSLDPEEALRGFMEVDPEKVREPLAQDDHDQAVSEGGGK